MKLKTKKAQENFYNDLGIDSADLSFVGRGNKSSDYFPVINLTNYKERPAGLSDFESPEKLKNTFYSKNMEVLSQKGDKLFIGYFGDSNYSNSEYMVVSNSVNEIYSYALDYDFDSSSVYVILINLRKKEYIVLTDLPNAEDMDLDDYFSTF